MATSSPRRSRSSASSAASAAPRAASTRSRSAAGSQGTGNGTSRRASLHDSAASARPVVGQRGRELQAFGTIARLPIGLPEKVCLESVQALNQVLADTMTLRDMYKKHHWQVAGETFYQLHL
ncbi:MAG TPA: ferritin-like domain-containing protein, partial [Chloroflexota bacterium]|nr:ferritin-like domain-containing protein [Chloroflexota bacterium]